MCYSVTHDVHPSQPRRPPRSPDDGYLDAAREAILAVGWSRTTLTDIARRAGVSRMTLYRRWPDTQTLLADLMTREWGRVVERRPSRSATRGDARARITAAWSPRSGRCAPTRCSAGSSRSTPRCCCPTCSTGAAAARTWSPTRSPALIGEGQRDGRRPPRRPGVLARVAAARLPRVRALGAHDGRRGPARATPTWTAFDDELAHLVDGYLVDERTIAAMSPAAIHVGLDGLPESTDVLVIGLGITGAGVALDAASRGLDVVAVDAHDVAFGTSRWSSKLVHGGLRYLAKGQLDVAHESAVERGILMETTAPHLVHALPMLMPLTPDDQPRPGRARPQRHPRRRPAAAGRPHPARDAAPAAPDRGHRDARPSPPSYAGRACAGRSCPGTASSRTTYAWSSRVARTAVAARRPRAHPGPGQRADRHRRRAHRRPHRGDPHDPRPHGRQRHRRLGRPPGPGDPAAAQPRHPPGAAQGHPARRALRDHGAGPGRQQPVRLRAAPARPDLLRRPHRRGGRRRDPRRARARRRRTSTSCSA